VWSLAEVVVGDAVLQGMIAFTELGVHAGMTMGSVS
jgi:hypothetical protein